MKFLPVLILALAFVGVAVADRRDRQLCYLARKMKYVYYAVHDVFYTVHSIEKKIDDCPLPIVEPVRPSKLLSDCNIF